ncbi:NAD(P)H-dependent oxidoreductase [Agrobacterium leguminum]
MSVSQAKAWADVRSVYERLEAADLLVISTPLWNNGTPYALKQFIDIVTSQVGPSGLIHLLGMHHF